MERKGLLTKPQEAVIVDALSEWINFKKAIFNVVKKPAIKAAIAAIDDIGLDRIPPDWKTDLIPIVDAAARHDVEEVRRLGVDLLSKRAPIPKVDAELTLVVYDGFTRLLVGTMTEYVIRKKAAKD